MPRLKTGTIVPTREEDAAITAAATADPDVRPLTDAEWEVARKTAKVGRPPIPNPKRMVSLRLDQDVVDGLRATGPGWQSRVNAMLREWLETHPVAAEERS